MDPSNSPSVFKECEFKWNEVLSALSNLSLKWVTIGDYVVVMNSEIDATIGGEPYLALQLWFNIKSGKIISRVWDQTVVFGKAVSVSQFSEACITHFTGRPCVGYPAFIDEYGGQDFVISQTPRPRKISRTCQKVLNPGTDPAVKSCPECLKLGVSPEDEEEDIDPEPDDDWIPEKRPRKSVKVKRIKTEEKYDIFQESLEEPSSPLQNILVSKQESASDALTQNTKAEKVSIACETCGKVLHSRRSYERHKSTHIGGPIHKGGNSIALNKVVNPHSGLSALLVFNCWWF